MRYGAEAEPIGVSVQPFIDRRRHAGERRRKSDRPSLKQDHPITRLWLRGLDQCRPQSIGRSSGAFEQRPDGWNKARRQADLDQVADDEGHDAELP